MTTLSKLRTTADQMGKRRTTANHLRHKNVRDFWFGKNLNNFGTKLKRFRDPQNRFADTRVP